MKKVIYLICLAGVLSLYVCCEFGLIFGEEGYGGPKYEPPPAPSPEYLEYLEHVKAQPLDFQIAASEDAGAWKRAHDILKKYSTKEWCPRKFRVSTVDVLEKDVAKHSSYRFEDVGYLIRIVRVPAGGTTKYTVSYAPTVELNGSHYPSIKAHAQVIAYYISSGEIMDYVWSSYYFESLVKH